MADAIGGTKLTNLGLAAYAEAAATGSKIQPASFKVTATDIELDPTLTAVPNTWLEADISVYAVIDPDTVEYTLDIPPDQATAYFRAAGLFLADGTLLAVSKPPYGIAPACHQKLKIQIKYNNSADMTDFQYLDWDETEQDVSRLEMQVTLGDQILKNASDIGRLKEWLADLSERTTGEAQVTTLGTALGGSGTSDLLGQVLTNFVVQSYSEKISRISGATGSVHMNSDLYPVFDVSIGAGEVSFVFSGDIPADKARSFELYLTQNETAQTVTWPAAVIWSTGTEPDLSTADSKHAFVFKTLDGGSIWWGFHAGKEAA